MELEFMENIFLRWRMIFSSVINAEQPSASKMNIPDNTQDGARAFASRPPPGGYVEDLWILNLPIITRIHQTIFMPQFGFV